MIDCSKTENYFAEKRRMTKRCELGCSNCPLNKDKILSCIAFQMLYPEKAIEIVQKWSDEHSQKTYLTELLKSFPSTPLGDDGTPEIICPHHLGLKNIKDCEIDANCVECWNQPVEVEGVDEK